MLSRLRRPATLAVSVLLLTTLAACGDDTGEEASGLDRLDAVSVSGDPGKAPKVTWKDQMSADGIEVEVLVEGDGDTVAEDDQVTVNYWVGNGFTQRKTFSTYDQGGQPETITVNDELLAVFRDALLDQAIGSRVAVTASAPEAFGESGNPQLGIGNQDSVLVLVDLVELYEAPEPVEVPASRMPKIVEEKGVPTALDFTGLPEPEADGDLMRTVLEEGNGKVLTTDMKVKVNYLGSVYDADKPFDESFSGEPLSLELSGFVPGFTFGLEGVKAGSRVLLAIPPALGYGEQEQANIPANSTLYFVVDIISAA
ncbi:peptidylprolyl isomerase [Nocardioides psychrotolerans]|uniref:Peptidyl-prolyl cis-trans isomerase n=1 Tax=Nocardioides psychrotolerans TaxID=1005945 RepID=A0A1I3K298_9ACTN|nr:FKBP-type peptidyl-prolyl cis-trans isomerase [Nocardioides psychrotolerans]GEP38398.1 peptidylprolyl isomerase [Nocardioides psychrotolerans]SFI66641.1 peptidylprolyl isomerase [Nocardioides psychrotolerans]